MKEIDYFEYSSNALVQTAYVSSNPIDYTDDFLVGGTATADSSFSLPMYSPEKAVDDNTSTAWDTNPADPLPHWWKYDLGSGVTKIAKKLRINRHSFTWTVKDFILQGSNNDSDWTELMSGTIGATAGWYEWTFSNNTAYRYYRLWITSGYGSEMAINEIELMEEIDSLQCYSESTIKEQGSYSMKIFAQQTNSLNESLVRTLISPIDKSYTTLLKIKVRASRTGTNLRIRIHDSGGTWTTKDVNITSADTWQEVVWNIGGVANTDKDEIDQIEFKILNADSDTIYYVDDFIGTLGYRISRNIEASIIDFLREKFSVDWSSIKCEKTFAKIYSLELPSVCVRVGTSDHSKVQIGSNATVRDIQVLIDIFATSDGIRLDLKDYIIEKIKNGMIYYETEINEGQINNQFVNGRIRVTNIEETPINFGENKDLLDIHDRYRHLLTFTVSLGRVE